MTRSVALTVKAASWFRSAVDQRIREAARLVPEGGTVTTLVVPLCDRPTGASREAWDRACDRCGVHVPPHRDFTCGTYQAGLSDRTGRHKLTVHLVFGLCATCAAADFAA